MPKKRHQNFTKYTSNHGSSHRSTNSVASSSTPSSSVNERLERLRREESLKADVDKRREVATIATAATLPPHLRHLLNLPETAPPRPKPGTRVVARRRLPPGPAAPLSWLHASQHAPTNIGERDKGAARGRMNERRATFAREDGSHVMPETGSLVDTALKTLAMNWDTLLEYEQYNLSSLPVSLKSSLLTYLGRFASEDGIDINTLKTIFLTNKELPGATGSEELTRLDLSGLITQRLTIAEVHKYWNVNGSKRASQNLDIAPLSISEPPSKPAQEGFGTPPENTTIHQDEVAESWEEEYERRTLSLPKAISIVRFPNLTHLSLSHPNHPAASWNQLLTLSTHLSTITHLSLAYWPTPSVTPNSKTAFVHSKHSRPVHLGGSNLYSALDDDWHEAANILRRLSNNTCCLRWLDLEGCSDWLPALTWTEEKSDSWPKIGSSRVARTSTAEEQSEVAQTEQGPGWNGSWKQLTYVNVSQGWIPADTRAIRTFPGGRIPMELLAYLRRRAEHTEDEVEGQGKCGGKDEEERITHLEHLTEGRVQQWLEREQQARRVAGQVRALRSGGKGLFCRFDFGWEGGVGKVVV